MNIGLQDIDATDYGKYYKIHDSERGVWYYHEWLIVCLIMAWLDMGGINYERWK